MADYILRDDAVCIADYAVDEHPYDKDRTRPETCSDYNQGWNDACDYIRGKLEAEKPADVKPVRYGRWEKRVEHGRLFGAKERMVCSCCGSYNGTLMIRFNYCPNCGTKMEGNNENN